MRTKISACNRYWMLSNEQGSIHWTVSTESFAGLTLIIQRVLWTSIIELTFQSAADHSNDPSLITRSN